MRRKPRVSRVPPDERRRQILDVAAALLSDRGVDSVEITTVAARAGVSRPLVYRLFPTRAALIAALLEDFVDALGQRFAGAMLRALPADFDGIVAAFVVACCDTIDERGAGPWRLLDARGVDPDLTRVGQHALGRLLSPWHARISELTGLSQRRAMAVLQVVVAAGRSMLEGWLDGSVGRKEAIRETTRAVSALLREFAQGP